MSESKTVVVTGASSGVGAAIAAAFGTLGWRVAVGARRSDKLEETARAIKAAGGKAFAHALDVTSAESIDAFFAASEAAFGAIDVIVNETAPGRERRRGQLLLSGRRGGFVYLQGDRQAREHLLPLRIVERAQSSASTHS